MLERQLRAATKPRVWARWRLLNTARLLWGTGVTLQTMLVPHWLTHSALGPPEQQEHRTVTFSRLLE